MSKDKPFRELQFSSAQLVVVFLGILVLGVFIFLLGISVGKKQTQLTAGASVAAKTEAVAPKTPVSADAVVAVKPEEAKPQDKPVEKPADKPDVKPLAKPANKPAVKPGEPGGGGTEIKPKPAIVAEKAAPTTAKPAEAKPAIVVGPPGATTETAKPAAKPKGRFYVQIGAVTDKPAAKLYGQRVELLGFPSRVLDPLATDKKTVFRVRIGPYETKTEADDAQDKLAAALKKKKTDFFIVVD